MLTQALLELKCLPHTLLLVAQMCPIQLNSHPDWLYQVSIDLDTELADPHSPCLRPKGEQALETKYAHLYDKPSSPTSLRLAPSSLVSDAGP